MLKTIFTPLALLAFATLAVGGSAAAAPGADVQAVGAAGSDFGFRLLQVLATDHTNGPNANVFFSPFSVSQALTLAMNGAGGQTRDVMAKTLGLELLTQDRINAANAALLPALTSDPSVQVSVANALWANAGLPFSPAFEADAKQFYRAQTATLDFHSSGAAGTINGWVSKNTQGRIPQIVTPDDLKYATNILTNAVYFHGKWQTPFEPVNTKIKPFHLPGGGTKPVPLMEQFSEVAYSETPQFQAAALPYGAGRTAMVILLPKPSVSVETLALSLTGETAAQWLAAMPPTDVELYLPRFKADMSASLGDSLSTLGMKAAFEDAADFSRMTSRRTKLSAVLHVATLDVNEQGTIAAAATGAVAMAGAMPAAPPPPPPVMRVDRPFIVLIRDTETGSLLFAGVIRDPK